MKSVFVITFLAIAGFTLAQDATQVTANTADSKRADLRIEIMNEEFRNMNPNEPKRLELANDSYIELDKSDDLTLHVTVMIYSPGDETYKKAYEGTYVWNDLANSLVAEVCKEHPVEINEVTTPVDCDQGIFTASRIIGLELEGTVDIQGYQSENLEKCIASKLPPKTVEIPYNKCMVTILGDPRYVGDAVQNKIKELEAQGYHCEENGECVKSEDPQIFADLLEGLKGQPVQVAVPGDHRPRYCDLKYHPLMAQIDDGSKYLSSFQYSCNYWVNNVYCYRDGSRLYWSVEYIDANGHKELFQTHPFNVVVAEKINVDWKNNERIHFIDFYSNPRTLAIKEMEFRFSSGRRASCNLGEQSPDRSTLNMLPIGFAGEYVGNEYKLTSDGVVLKGVHERN